MNKYTIPEEHRLFFSDFMESVDTKSLNHFFKKNYSTKKEKDILFNFIINSSFFFMFRTHATNRDEIEQQSLLRTLPFFKLFPLTEQISLLNSPIHNFNISNMTYFENLNVNKKSINQLSSNSVSFLLTDLFHKECFHILDYLEDKLNKNIDNTYSHIFSVHYKEQYSYGCFNISMDKLNPSYKPIYDIIFNYTDNKKNYIINKGMNLPSKKEIDSLAIKILPFITEPHEHSHIELFNEKVAEYSKIILSYDLENSLSQKSKIRKNKI